MEEPIEGIGKVDLSDIEAFANRYLDQQTRSI